MFVLICNSGDGESLWSTLKGVFETHREAHDAMVELIETHKADWEREWNASEDYFTTKVRDDEGELVDGDIFDWRYYEKYLIFDSDNPSTIGY